MKKILFAGLVVLAAAVARADFLYWQVSDKGDFTYATLYATDGTSNYELDTVGADGVDMEAGTGNITGTTAGPTSSDISSYASSEYSFFVELVTYSNWSDENPSKTQKFDSYSYDELVSGGYISAGGVNTPAIGIATGGGYNMAVPEPTSGLLMLLGGALMALRRRRRA